MIRAISDLCSEGRAICYGIVQPGRHVEGGLPILRVANLRGDRIDTSDVMRIDPEIEKKYKRSRIQENDVLVSLVGSMGQVAIAGKEIEGWNVARAVGIIPATDRHHAEWIRYSLQSREAQQFIADHANTTVQATFNLRDLSRLPIPYPDEAARKDILSILTALDNKIELNRRMSATLEEMARALYRSWFVDFDPVHARALGQPPAHMDPTTAALFPDSFGPDGLPKGWEVCPLSEVCKQVKQTVKPMAAPDTEFLHFSLPAFDAGRMPVREAGAAIKSNKAHVPHDAILFSRLNPSIPRVWWAKTEAMDGTPAASTEFFVAAAHDPVETSWLYCLLSSSDFRDEALSRVTGTSNSHQRIPPKALAEIEVIAPQPEIVEAFGELSGPWFEKVHAMAHENQTLAALRDALLPRLMSGELRIREAEKEVKEYV
ncbi:MAG: restriction endonuclease subunit S [Rhodobacteraceae bacterium]|nr:restriction endonuclease subunit S [Paracoccaceae bacterium]